MRLALIALVTLAYPLLVWLGMAHLEPRWLAVGLAVLALARAAATRERLWLVAAAGALVLAAAAALGNALLPLKLYPALVNAVLLTVFAVSLMHPPSAIERLARLREPDLPPAAIAYTRKVTWVWCGFFVVNGTLALATALWADAATWALYNGLIAYGLIGTLFAIEWLVRRRVRARHAAAGDLR